MTYNVRGLRAGVPAVERVVRATGPEILLLQESGSRRALRTLASTLGMGVAADPVSFPRRRVKNAVLVRPPWELLGARLHRFEGSARFYPRGALIADLRNGPIELRCASVHLGLRPAERMRHVRELAQLLPQPGTPSLIGGDFNEFPDARPISFLGERFDDAWTERGAGAGAGETFPATEPAARIDFVFISASLEVPLAVVPGGADVVAASDHRPVVVDLALGSD
jgi:endonuclease/exonuclease/phosphatase family metal-dependent hydrolase